MNKFKIFIFLNVFICLFWSVIIGSTESLDEMIVEHKEKPQKVLYDLYLPAQKDKKPLGVLICIGGLPIIDNKYVHSDSQECSTPVWEEFSKKNQVAILGLGFLFDANDWDDKTSYQYAQAWSGDALIKILDRLSKQHPLNTDELYLFGISAGAQFSVRFALMAPEKTKAVAVHAAGGYDLPREFIKTKFLITVGEFDDEEISRVQWAKYFIQGAKEKGIDVQFKIIEDIAHRQTEQQNELSRKFFENVLNNTH